MRSVLYLIRQFPGELANETIDLMLVSGVFEQPTSVVFIGNGVWQLVGDGSKIERKDTARALNARIRACLGYGDRSVLGTAYSRGLVESGRRTLASE